MRNGLRKSLLGWGVLAAATWGIWAHWHEDAAPEPAAAATEVTTDLLADEEAARASAYDLLVDFKDDIGAEVLAATPYAEEALSDYTAEDKLHRIRFDSFEEARAAAEVLRRNPNVETVDWDAPASLS